MNINLHVRRVAIGLILAASGPLKSGAQSVLSQRVGPVDCRDRTVASAVDVLSHQNGIRIVVNWESLGGDDMHESKVNLSFNGCRVSDAIRAIFPAAEICEDDAGLQVMGREAAPVALKGYAVGDLERMLGPGSAEQLLNLVEGSVRPDDWADNGGRFEIRIQGTLLVAAQTPEGHEVLAQLLESMRSVMARSDPVMEVRQVQAVLAPGSNITTRRLPELRFRQTPLEAVIASLQAAAHVGAVIHWDRLKDAGIEPGNALTIDLSGRTLPEALELVRDVCGVNFVLYDGVMDVTCGEAPAPWVDRRVFDMRPMIAVVQSYVSGTPGWRATVNPEGVVSAFEDLIQREVQTDSWKDNGGAIGRCGAAGDFLVVTNTPGANEQVAALMSDIQAASQPATQPPPDKPDRLEASVGDVEFSGTELEEAIDTLGRRSRTEILVDWKSLEGAGVARNASITVKIYAGSLRKSLNVVLELAGMDKAPLAFRADDVGIVHVGSADKVGTTAITRIYNIRDLIERYVNYNNIAGKNIPDREQAARADAIDKITGVIESTIDPDSWKDNGGSVGSMREFAGLLIVTTDTPNHRTLKTFLETLRTQTFAGNEVER